MRTSLFLAGLACWGLIACGGRGTSSATTTSGGSGGGSAAGSGGRDPGRQLDPGRAVEVKANLARLEEEQGVRAAVDGVSELSASGFRERYPVHAETAPHYERARIAGLDRIQASSFKLSEAALGALEKNGFAIDKDSRFPSFTYGYQTLYLEDLPLYVSADSILNALHVSYDDILKLLEVERLSGELDALLAGMHARLASGVGAELGASVVADTDLFIAVARNLLKERDVGPRAGAAPAEVLKITNSARKAEGVSTFTLFGVKRENEDFSQFKPRGHYTDSPELGRYFKAMMWLGRIDLRLLETQLDGSQVFRRRQAEIMMLLRELVGSELRSHFDAIDRTVAAFVGEPDYMVLDQVDALVKDLGINGLSELAGISDEVLAQAIIDGGYGAQRISSHIMINGTGQGTLPLSRSFAFLGQRYVIDSHVFSNVVYDRIGQRMLPSPLDVAFAALGNDRAGELLAPELKKYEAGKYPGALASMRLLVDEHPADYWRSSLYTLWLGALRELSPGASGVADAASTPGLFPAARSEAWQRRMLNSQLSSWAELRHDTILYAKQSYTGGAACEFPDAYVDPYPEFYAAVAAYGDQGAALVDALPGGSSTIMGGIRAHFTLLADVARRLEQMAKHELTGAEFTPEMMEFINDAVVVQNICGGGTFESGWYKKLFFNPASALEPDPTIADVHTQPTDEGGAFVGKVLHVGTGTPRGMVVVAEGCSGPRAYAGLVANYRERVTDNFERLDDPQWAGAWQSVPDVPWMSDLVAE